MLKDKFRGVFIGLAIGDALGRFFERGNFEYEVFNMVLSSKTILKYTDDTNMSTDIAKSCLKHKKIEEDELARQFADSFDQTRGYGRAVSVLLKDIKKGYDWRKLNKRQYKDGSLGNGGAMRSAILSLCFFKEEIDVLFENVKKATRITHDNALAIKGAQLQALSVYGALKGLNKDDIIDKLLTYAEFDVYIDKIKKIKTLIHSEKVDDIEVIKNLGNGVLVYESVPSAIYAGLKYRDKSLISMLEKIYEAGGDTDTLGAMSGALWGAFNGYQKIDLKIINRLENGKEIKKLSDLIYGYLFGT